LLTEVKLIVMIYCHDTHVYFTSLTGASKITIIDYENVYNHFIHLQLSWIRTMNENNLRISGIFKCYYQY